METSYKTSVIIGTFNGEKYIGEQLDSILNQTILPNEIVICDDDSTDRTIEVVKEILTDSGIRYVLKKNKNRLGILENYEKCNALCSGDIVFVCDQDNVWSHHYIESFLRKFEQNPQADYIYCNGYVTDENGKILHETYTDEFMNRSKEQFLSDVINQRLFPHGHTIAYKKKFKDTICPSYFVLDEWISLCIAVTGNFVSVNEKLVYFRRHGNSFSQSEKINEKNQTGFLKKISNKRLLCKLSFDQYFSWPESQYNAYFRVVELFATNLDRDTTENLRSHADFEMEINNLRYRKVFSRLCKLKELYKGSCYQKYRGNRNTFFSDCLYLVFAKRDNTSLNQK